jgi:hypothetical protein
MMRKIFMCFFCLMISLASACSQSSDGEVRFRGKVTVDGNPVEAGIIEFEAVKRDTSGGGGAIQNGAYTARVMPGEKIVRIKAYKNIREYTDSEGNLLFEQESLVPESKSWSNSELRETISNKTKELNFDLKSK